MSASAIVDQENEYQPLSLFFDLESGLKADLEVIASISLELVRALKEAAQEISPNLDIKVEVISGTEGSLSLNTIITSLKSSATAVARADLRILALAAAGWLGPQTANWTYKTVLDAVYHTAAPVATTSKQPAMTDEEAGRIATKLNQLQQSPDVQKHVTQIYVQAQRDVTIIGLGINTDVPGTRPQNIVPRHEFHDRRLNSLETVEVKSTRLRDVEETVQLITAVLDPTSNRRWVIRSSVGLVSAAMGDKTFLKLLKDGKITTRLNGNTKLRVDLAISERLVGKDWKLNGIKIARVRQIILPDAEQDLLTVSRN